MSTSILALVGAGKNLLNSLAPVNYPAEGASMLSSVEINHFWFRVRRELILKLLRRYLQISTPIGIDVGCGSGFTDVWLAERGYSIIGVDAYDGFKENAQLHPQCRFIQGDLLSVEPAPEFDFVLLMDVLEHLQDDVEHMKHITKLLKPGGVVIVTVPAFRSLWSAIDDFSGHLRRYGREEINTLKKGVADQLVLRHASFFYFSTLPIFLISRLVAFNSSQISKKIETEGSPPAFVNYLLLVMLRFELKFALKFCLPTGSSWFAVFQKI